MNNKYKKPKPNLCIFLLLLSSSLISFSFLLYAAIPFSSTQQIQSQPPLHHQTLTPCSSSSSLCCDRTSRRSDICFMAGGLVLTDPRSNSLLLLVDNTTTATPSIAEEKIRPYTRKWETDTMSTIDELRLRAIAATTTGPAVPCDIRHDVPAVVFSTGGYTGNVYHEFNDGIIPLYITSRRFDRRVALVVVEYHDWWETKYADVLSALSDFPPIDFSNGSVTHCFPRAIVGLNIHDELSVDDGEARGATIGDFRRLLDEAYRSRIEYIVKQEGEKQQHEGVAKRPKLVIVSRGNGSRGIENEHELATLASDVGFRVHVLRPDRTTELAKIYRALNSSDVMVGVHGAAMTHFLFMRPGSVFIQIVPLGTDWAAETYYGQPAKKLGLRYTSYKIRPVESSLYNEYPRDDPVLRDPTSVNARGWEVTKRVYLDGQKVRIDLPRFRRTLMKAYRYLASAKGKRERKSTE